MIEYIMQINWVLILVVAVIIFFSISGYRSGFVRLLISILSMVLTCYLVWAATPYICDYLMENTTLYSTAVESIRDAFEEANSKRDNTIYENQIETINSYEVPEAIKKSLLNNNKVDVYRGLMVEAFEDYVSAFLGKLFIRAMAFVITFVMVMIVLKMTFLSMDFISRIPVISTLNKLAGGVFGFVQGLFVVWLGFTFATVCFYSDFIRIVDSSKLLKALYSSNMVLWLL